MPYQLHCWPAAILLDEGTELDDGVEDGTELEEGMDESKELDGGCVDEGAELEITPLHRLPVSVGISAEPPFLLP